MAHVVEKNQYFLFRTKDIHSKGLIGNFDFPDTDSFDIQIGPNGLTASSNFLKQTQQIAHVYHYLEISQFHHQKKYHLIGY